jgi:hypothetical protein
VDQEHAARLHQLIHTIQRRWGQHALRLFGQASASEAIPVIPTGFPDLDAALRLHVGRQEWLDDDDMPLSCRTRVSVLKSKFGALDATVDVTISFVNTWRVS